MQIAEVTFFLQLEAWVEMYVDVHLLVIWKDWVFECFLLKRKFREKKMEEHNSENFMRLLSGNTINTKQNTNNTNVHLLNHMCVFERTDDVHI